MQGKRQKLLIPLYRFPCQLGRKIKKVHELHELPRIKNHRYTQIGRHKTKKLIVTWDIDYGEKMGYQLKVIGY
jgi:hypothetical protein